MLKHHIEESLVVEAESQAIYSLLSDYPNGHSRIVPKEYFTELVIEKGGVGAGTVVRGKIRILGKTTEFRHIVSEPAPGRVLVETDLDGNTITTFTLTPEASGKSTRVTIGTDFMLKSSGLRAKIERTLISWIFPGIYRKELGLIRDEMRSRKIGD